MEYHHCRGCTKAMRPPTARIYEWPGTVLHGGYGYCYNCRKRQKKGLAVMTELVEEPRPPRELDPEEKAVLRLLEKRGLPEEYRSILGLDETERPQPLTDLQMMKNALTNPGGGTFGVFSDSDTVLRNAVAHGSVKGRRL